MSDINKINISSLKTYYRSFDDEKDNFNSDTYHTFSSSYIKRCSDSNIMRMADDLERTYAQIKAGYENISTWWKDYNDNAEALEHALSKTSSVGLIRESSLRNYVNSNLGELINSKYQGLEIAIDSSDAYMNSSMFINNDAALLTGALGVGIASGITSTVANFVNKVNNNRTLTEVNSTLNADFTDFIGDAANGVIDFFSDVGASIASGVSYIGQGIGNWWSEVTDWWANSAAPWFEQAANAVWDVVNSVGATVATLVTSLVEGIGSFGEAIIDFAALAGTAVCSVFTGLYDGGQAIYGAITGNEWTSATKTMWDATMGFVSEQHVTGWFDSFYENTTIGNWMKESAYGFDITRSIGSGIGYVAGIVALTVCTFGVGGAAASGGTVTLSGAAAATSGTQMAIVAGAAGMGRGTEDAWANGANLEEGLLSGGLNGVIDGLGFYIGAKISGIRDIRAIRNSGFGQAISGIIHRGASSTLGARHAVTKSVRVSLLTPLIRIILDGIDGGAQEVVRPVIVAVYKDGYIDENGDYVLYTEDDTFFDRYVSEFRENGGWNSVKTGAAIGSSLSLIGELFDLSGLFHRKFETVEYEEQFKAAIGTIDDTLGAMEEDTLDALLSKDRGPSGKVAGVELFKTLGYDETPTLVSSSDFARLADSSEYGVLYRGVSGEDALKYVDEFKYGPLYVGGKNGAVKGTGVYTAYGPGSLENIAEMYASDGGKSSGAIMKMVISDDAKIVASDQLEEEMASVLDALSKQFNKYDKSIVDRFTLEAALEKITDAGDLKKARLIVDTLSNPGYYASIRGYDAINVTEKNFLIICNRGKVIMEAA